MAIADLVSQTSATFLSAVWLPGHLDPSLLEDAFEDWASMWNEAIDSRIGTFNFARSADFVQLFESAVSHAKSVQNRCKQLRLFYFRVADESHSSVTMTVDSAAPEVSPFDFDGSDGMLLNSMYNLSVPDMIETCGWNNSKVPPSFVQILFDWLQSQGDEGVDVYNLSFVELTLGLAHLRDFRFPFFDPDSRQMTLQSIHLRLERPTLSYLMKSVRDALVGYLRLIDAEDVLMSKQNKVDLQIMRPVDGVRVKLQRATVQALRNRTLSFTRTRALRRTCDFARPV